MGVSCKGVCLKILKLPTVSLEFAQESRKIPKLSQNVATNVLFSREFHQWHDDIGHHHSMGTWHGRASTNKRNPGKFPTFYPFGIHLYIGSDWLVVDLPLWKIWKSNGIMTFPNIWKNKECSKLDMLVYPFSYIPQEASPTWCFIHNKHRLINQQT